MQPLPRSTHVQKFERLVRTHPEQGPAHSCTLVEALYSDKWCCQIKVKQLQQVREREREIALVHSASLAYEEKCCSML